MSSLQRQAAWAFAASTFARLMLITVNLAIFPVLFARLPPAEIGVWLLINQVNSFAGLFDLGIVPTLTRKIAMCRAKEERRGQAEPGLWSRYAIELHATGEIVLRSLGCVIFVIAVIVGLPILLNLDLQELQVGRVVVAYLLICLGIAVRTGTSNWECQLLGAGRVVLGTGISVVVQVMTAMALLFVAFVGGGLIELAATVLLGIIAGRFAMKALMASLQVAVVDTNGCSVNRRVLKSLVGPAMRCWFTNLGSILLFQVDNFFIAKWMGPQRVPDYRAAFQLMLNIQMIATTIGTSASVFVSRSWGINARKEVSTLTQRNLYWAGVVMAAGYSLTLVCAEELFEIWLGASHFVGMQVLFAIVVTLSIQGFVWTLMTAARATEHEVFSGWSLAGAFVNLFLTWLTVERFGYVGVALSTGLALVLTIGWFGTWKAAERLQMPWWRIGHALCVFCLRFAVYTTAAATFKSLVNGELTIVVGSLIVISSVAVIDIWLNLLRPDERSYLVDRLRFS